MEGIRDKKQGLQKYMSKLGDDVYVYYLDCSYCFAGVFISQNNNCTLSICTISVCQLGLL